MEWIADHPLTTIVVYGGICLYICFYTVERYFFFNGLGRLKKKDTEIHQRVRQRKAINCVVVPRKAIVVAIMLGLFLGVVVASFGAFSFVKDLYLIESTPTYKGRVEEVTSIKKRGSKGSTYYVYDLVVKADHQVQVIRSRRQFRKGSDFFFHKVGKRWLEHTNGHHIIQGLTLTPFYVFLCFFFYFYTRVMLQALAALKVGRKQEVEIVKADSSRVKNGFQVYYWFYLDEVMYSMRFDVKKKQVEEYLEKVGERILVVEMSPLFLKRMGLNPWKHLEDNGFDRELRARARLLVFNALTLK